MSQEPHLVEIAPHPYSAVVRGALRSIAASIPGAASLGQAWNEYETHRTASRIQELFDNLKAALEGLVVTVGDYGNVLKQCQDFPELLEITIDKVRKEFGKTKRATYARVLARLVVGSDASEHEDRVALLEGLDSLSETDLQVLMLFQGKEEVQIRELLWRELGFKGDASNHLWEYSCHLAKLESRGLLLKVSHGNGVVYVPHGMTAAVARSQESKYRLLPLGGRLIEVLL